MSTVGLPAHAGASHSGTFPKIELHVHLEGTVRARTLLQIARRNGVPLPADSVEGLAGLYDYRASARSIEVWVRPPGALRPERNFRKVGVAMRPRRPATARSTSRGSS